MKGDDAKEREGVNNVKGEGGKKVKNYEEEEEEEKKEEELKNEKVGGKRDE